MSQNNQVQIPDVPLKESAIRLIENLGATILTGMQQWGKAWIFFFKVLAQTLLPPFRWQLFFNQLYHIGVLSTFVVALIGLFTGAVMAVQGVYTLNKFGATGFTGSLVALSLIRELGPVLTAFVVIGRAGSATTAELGIMRITEQIDALKSMAVNPLKYLMVPRLLAAFVALPILTAIFIVVGIFGGYLVAVGLLNISSGTFLSQMYAEVDARDIYSGLAKPLVFGVIMGWVSCYKGYTCGFGAVGVNRATTESVVTASVAVLIANYFMTSILTRYLL
jgi:phospholipid/cholesterol/gamma-HCH transport system permease protein